MLDTAAQADRLRWQNVAMAIGATALIVAALFVNSELFLVFAVVAAIMVPAERLLALRPQPTFRRGWRADIVHHFVNNTAVKALLGAIVVGIYMLSSAVVPDSLHDAIARQPIAFQFVEAVFLSELCYYFAHRAAHHFPLLWRFHAVHHSIEEMDWLAAGRLHPIDQVFTRTCAAMPVAVLGFNKAAFAVFVILNGFQAILVHSNLNVSTGPLRWLVTTPEFHHWHHANEPAAYNTNFAGALPVMDLVFGTARLPRDGRPEKLGIDSKLPEAYVAQLAWPFHAFSSKSPADQVAAPETAEVVR